MGVRQAPLTYEDEYRWAIESGAEFSWVDDPNDNEEIYDSEEIYGPLGCVMRDKDSRIVASLWGILLSGKDDPYRHEVETELAAEAKFYVDADASLIANTPELRALIAYVAQLP